MGKPEGKRALGTHSRKCVNIIKMDLRGLGCGAWTGLIWLRKWTNCGLFLIWYRNFEFHKIREFLD